MNILTGTTVVIGYQELDRLVKATVGENAKHALVGYRYIDSKEVNNDTWDFYSGLEEIEAECAAEIESGEYEDMDNWTVLNYLLHKGVFEADHVIIDVCW